ncbi:hypothetical protein [Streptomyces sp. NPDC058418]|uniref:hypothetical protein n=1 Tax=Streptomyces sp. NPDC058418 TaxID=3346488 RepID=UPI00365B8704
MAKPSISPEDAAAAYELGQEAARDEADRRRAAAEAEADARDAGSNASAAN